MGFTFLYMRLLPISDTTLSETQILFKSIFICNYKRTNIWEINSTRYMHTFIFCLLPKLGFQNTQKLWQNKWLKGNAQFLWIFLSARTKGILLPNNIEEAADRRQTMIMCTYLHFGHSFKRLYKRVFIIRRVFHNYVVEDYSHFTIKAVEIGIH